MKWIAAALLATTGGWMTFDGARALVVGDYVTPRSGAFAGRLGPWSTVVERVGIPARATSMKAAFVVVGLIHLAAAVFLVTSGAAGSEWLALAAGLTGLWYLPFGTVADGIALIIVLTTMRPW